MNKLEQTSQELLEAGYTIEEIKAAFEEVIEQAKQTNINAEQITNKVVCFFVCTFHSQFPKMVMKGEIVI